MRKHLSFLEPSQNLDMMVHAGKPSSGVGRDRRIPGIPWSGRASSSVSPRPKEPAFRSKVDDNHAMTSQIALWPLQNTCSYTHMNVHTQRIKI